MGGRRGRKNVRNGAENIVCEKPKGAYSWKERSSKNQRSYSMTVWSVLPLVVTL